MEWVWTVASLHCSRIPPHPHSHLHPQAAASALLLASPLATGGAALAGEFDLLAESTPTTYVLDDASVLNKTTKKSVGEELRALEVSVAGRRLPRGGGDCIATAAGHLPAKRGLLRRLVRDGSSSNCSSISPVQSVPPCHWLLVCSSAGVLILP